MTPDSVVNLVSENIWILLVGLVVLGLAIGLVIAELMLFPEVIAGIALRLEKRIAVGTWVEGDGFHGVVERIGARSTTLRDASDRLVDVPNRALIAAPFVSGTGTWLTHEATVTIEGAYSAEQTRRALEDAVYCSPWTPLEPMVVVSPDGMAPKRWRVRARVLDVRYVDAFEGGLGERAEEILRLAAIAKDPV